MSVLLVHGAGSSGAAARLLLGPLLSGFEVCVVEDRSGDIDAVVGAVDSRCRGSVAFEAAIGISLGAHALALGLSKDRGIPLVLVLPAWTGDPGEVARLTRLSADEIAERGIRATVARIRRESPATDVTDVLVRGWDGYTDSGLSSALRRAAASRAPTPGDLSAMSTRVSVIGWEGDPLHPLVTARQWAGAIPGARLAVAARPSVRLLRDAITTATGWRGRPRPDPEEATWAAPRREPSPTSLG